MKIRKGDTVTLIKAEVDEMIDEKNVRLIFRRGLPINSGFRARMIDIPVAFVEIVEPRPLRPGKARRINSGDVVDILCVDGAEAWVKHGNMPRYTADASQFENLD
jgi:hypothetical protein